MGFSLSVAGCDIVTQSRPTCATLIKIPASSHGYGLGLRCGFGYSPRTRMNIQTDPTPTPGSDATTTLITTPVRSLLKRAPVTLPPQTPIIEAARLMREHRISSVLIVQDGALFGLITDRDLRNRVVATGLDTSRPILEIATLAPLTIDIERPAFDALLLMARHNIHHVPVLDGQAVAGMISSSDLS
ncbi:MAG: hypothetical protein B7X56_00100, partial [Burkholderiales bacterium 34-67-9]